MVLIKTRAEPGATAAAAAAATACMGRDEESASTTISQQSGAEFALAEDRRSRSIFPSSRYVLPARGAAEGASSLRQRC